MTQEDKQLLLKDLCGRLPYGVKCLVNFNDGTKHIMILKTGKEYKQYLKSEVSQDICDKLGREYKGKKK